MNEVVDYIPISDYDSSSPTEQEEDDFVPAVKAVENVEGDTKVANDTTFDEDSDNCPICFEPWTSTGSHKLCCLRCGHLFGHSCIAKWITSQGKQSRCPQCNTKASRRDIRFVYTKHLRVMDTSDRDRALKDLTTERKLRHRAESEAAEHRAKFQLLEAEVAQLRDELHCVRSVTQVLGRTIPRADSIQQSSSSDGTGCSAYSGRYELMKSILISSSGNCRVMASCDYLNTLCISQPSTNPIFRGFGIRKLNTVDQRPMKYIHLHTQALRDLALHSDAQDGILVSVSLDKSVRLTSLLTDQVVQTYQCPSPVWSCCWASPNPHQFFAGCSNGSILVFDIRVTTGPLTTLNVPDNSSPVIALQYVPSSTGGSASPSGGLLVGQLTKITFMAEGSGECNSVLPPSSPLPRRNHDTTPSGNRDRSRSPDLFNANSNPPLRQPLNTSPDYTPHSLPLEGSLASLSLVPHNRHFLASYRPSQRLPRVRHVLAELQRDSLLSGGDDESTTTTDAPCLFTSREAHSLWAGSRMKMLTRARLFKCSDEDETNMMAVAGSEEAGGALIWRCDTGARLQALKPPDTTPDCPVIDVCPYQTNSSSASDKPQLALLTERSLHLYRWQAVGV